MKQIVTTVLYNLVLFTASVVLLVKNHDNKVKWKAIGSWVGCAMMFLFLCASLFVLVRSVREKRNRKQAG